MDRSGYAFTELQQLANKYDRTPYHPRFPYAFHPMLQLVPILGNILVFIQTAMFIHRVNQLVSIPYRERFEIWVSAIILLVLGMVPVAGFYLTLCCTICSDYLIIARRILLTRGSKQRVDIEAPMEICALDSASFIMSPIAKPASVHTAASIYTTREMAASTLSLKRQGSVMSSKSGSTKRGSIIMVEPPVVEQAKLDRVSRMNWMDEVMALSPTEDYRTSLSVNAINRNRSQTLYTNLHDLATRNSKMPMPRQESSSMRNLPSYLAHNRDSLFGDGRPKRIALADKRLTRSLHIDDEELDKRESLSKAYSMRTLSLFQILPSHAIELIVYHVAGSSHLLFDDDTESSDEYTILLMPLLSVCRDFRAAVLARYCRIHMLNLTLFSDKGDDKRLLWPARLRGIGFPTHLHAQELDITLGVFSVYNGTALRELLRVPHGDSLFPMVRSLKVTLNLTTQEQCLLAYIPTAQDIEPNIRAFVQRIRLMAPTTRKVCISFQSHSDDEPQFATPHFGSLVAQLSQLGDTIEHRYDYHLMRLELPPTGISSIVLMDYNPANGDLVMQLARHHAPTLRTLRIYVGDTGSMSQLLQNVDGSPVQYPYLTSLRLELRQDWDEEVDQQPLPAFPGASPFPKLRRLSFTSGYPFGDDTPFRSNAYTLEYLYLYLCSREVRIFGELQVFTHNSHPKLQCVRLAFGSYRPHSYFDTDISFMKFALTIGPNAHVRQITNWQTDPLFLPLIPVLGEYTCIQVLALPFMSMDVWDVIALVKALPLLTDLHTRFSKPEAWPSGIFDQHLPAYVITNYAPIGERFRCWRFADFHDTDVKAAVKCVLLLALICPNFDYAAVSAGDQTAFGKNKFCQTNGDGNYVFAGSCSQFFTCANGFGWLQDCPSDLLFDSELMECIYHEQVECDGRPQK
ncbi:hypothetical protein GGI17_002227 [Coemansia sp. S146]|nr:hypothetical protein GGI17_002227 [Coemansia sp. S146]